MLCQAHPCLPVNRCNACSRVQTSACPASPQGEPELSTGSEPAGPAEPAEVTKPPAPSRAQLALAPAAAVAATARRALAAASTHLCALAASVSAYLARIVPAGADMAHRVVLGLAEVVGNLRVRRCCCVCWHEMCVCVCVEQHHGTALRMPCIAL